MDGCHFACGVGNCGADDGNSGVGVSCALQMDGLGNYFHRPIDLEVLVGLGLAGQDAGRQGGCTDGINGSVVDPSRSEKRVLHHADKARVTAWKRRTPVRQRNLKNCAVVCNETLGFWFSPHFSAGRVSQFHRSSGDEYSSLSPSASRDAIAFDVGSLWEFRRQETLATESVGAAAVPRREALIMAALTSFLYRSHKISL